MLLFSCCFFSFANATRPRWWNKIEKGKTKKKKRNDKKRKRNTRSVYAHRSVIHRREKQQTRLLRRHTYERRNHRRMTVPSDFWRGQHTRVYLFMLSAYLVHFGSRSRNSVTVPPWLRERSPREYSRRTRSEALNARLSAALPFFRQRCARLFPFLRDRRGEYFQLSIRTVKWPGA